MSRPGQTQIQSDLFWSYQTNVAAYPTWQAWLSEHRPPTLVVWGRYDQSFTVAGAAAYKENAPDTEVAHRLTPAASRIDEEARRGVPALIRAFLARQPAPFGEDRIANVDREGRESINAVASTARPIRSTSRRTCRCCGCCAM